jgi:O-antigen ligase
MVIKRNTIKNFALFIVFFLAFSGYYAFLMMLTNIATDIDSRILTIPLRLIIVGMITFIFLLRPRRVKLQNELFFFLLFAIVYLIRILIESLDHRSTFHITEAEFFLYFTSFVLIPLFFVSQFRLSEDNYEKIFIAMMSSALVLAALSLYYYQEMIGCVKRMVITDENYISPLALSYSSVLAIGVGIAYLLTNEGMLCMRLFIYVTILMSFIPFFLGASRGSIVALSLPFLFYLVFGRGVKKRITLLLVISSLAIVLIFLTEVFGTRIFARLATISEIIEYGGLAPGGERIEIWEASLVQFCNNPVFGNSLNCDQTNFYPHNMLVEVLITTGIVGFVPFVLFLYIIFVKMVLMVKRDRRYFWVCVIFLQAFMYNMFSGGIYYAGWLSIGAGLVIGFDHRMEKVN